MEARLRIELSERHKRALRGEESEEIDLLRTQLNREFSTLVAQHDMAERQRNLRDEEARQAAQAPRQAAQAPRQARQDEDDDDDDDDDGQFPMFSEASLNGNHVRLVFPPGIRPTGPDAFEGMQAFVGISRQSAHPQNTIQRPYTEMAALIVNVCEWYGITGGQLLCMSFFQLKHAVIRMLAPNTMHAFLPTAPHHLPAGERAFAEIAPTIAGMEVLALGFFSLYPHGRLTVTIFAVGSLLGLHRDDVDLLLSTLDSPDTQVWFRNMWLAVQRQDLYEQALGWRRARFIDIREAMRALYNGAEFPLDSDERVIAAAFVEVQHTREGLELNRNAIASRRPRAYQAPQEGIPAAAAAAVPRAARNRGPGRGRGDPTL
jgi:hypothetical protein